MHIELKLDKRKSSKDSRYPIKVYVSEGRRSYMVATGFFCKEKEFDPVNGQLIGSGYKRPNQKLTTIMNRAEKETEGMPCPTPSVSSERFATLTGLKSSRSAHSGRRSLTAMT